MAQLTLRTLLAYIDDTLEPGVARELGLKVAESELALELIERIKKVTRRRGLKSPTATGPDDETADPNTVAEYLSDSLDAEHIERFEETCLNSDVHLAEVAACHQILTVILTEPVRVPPSARQRMYGLVPPPASVPNRKPGKTMPVGGILPAAGEKAESDDTDEALLLGMGRYSSGSWLTRAGLIGTVAALALMLVVAVIMAMPPRQPEPPESSLSYAASATMAAPKPTTTPESSIPPPHSTSDASKTKMPEPEVVKPEAKKPEPEVKTPEPGKEPKKKLVNVPIAARTDRVPIGEVGGVSFLALTRPDDGPSWLRLDPAGEKSITSYDQVLCLPGYKCDVQLENGVKVHLWGNVPDLLPARLLESRARFHVPLQNADGKGRETDADITLLGGRIYLSTDQATGAKVRVRFARQIWDFTLPDAKSEVMVEVVRSDVPGSPLAREGGPPPRIEARAAVIRGTAGLKVNGRAKSFDDVAAPAFVEWDSKTNTVAPPKPIEAGNGYYDKFPLLSSPSVALIEKAKTAIARIETKRDGVKLMLAEILSEPVSLDRIKVVELAVYCYASIIYGAAASEELKPLVDILLEGNRGYARLADVNALSAWIAQQSGNCELLEKALTTKTEREGEPETIVRLLRGYVVPDNPDPARVDRLIEYLNSPSVAIRELAQWNLINYVDPSAVEAEGMVRDVAVTGPDYDRFVKRWKARVEDLKKAPPPPHEVKKKEPEKKPPVKKAETK